MKIVKRGGGSRSSDAAPVFALQFGAEEVAAHAARFPSAGDAPVLAVGRAARARGRYTRGEFLAVCRWKTPRSAPLVVRNDARAVRLATTVALAAGSGDAERTAALLGLRGVGWPTASVLLHVADPDRDPILDARALHALGVRAPSAYTLAFWQAWRGAPCGDCRRRRPHAGPRPVAVVEGAGRGRLTTWEDRPMRRPSCRTVAAAAVAATLLLAGPGTAAARHVVHLRGTAYEFNNVGLRLGGATIGVAELPTARTTTRPDEHLRPGRPRPREGDAVHPGRGASHDLAGDLHDLRRRSRGT